MNRLLWGKPSQIEESDRKLSKWGFCLSRSWGILGLYHFPNTKPHRLVVAHHFDRAKAAHGPRGVRLIGVVVKSPHQDSGRRKGIRVVG